MEGMPGMPDTVRVEAPDSRKIGNSPAVMKEKTGVDF